MIGSPLQSPTERALAVISILVMIALATVLATQYARDRPGLERAPRSARNWNLLMVGLLAFTAGDLVPDLATETEAMHRLDEIAVIFIAFALVLLGFSEASTASPSLPFPWPPAHWPCWPSLQVSSSKSTSRRMSRATSFSPPSWRHCWCSL